jgi:hypothetical protein
MAGLERRVRELAEKLDELSRDRADWAKKYEELSKKNEVTYEFDFLESVKIEEKDTTV